MRNNKYRILQNIIQGKGDGRRGPGRRVETMILSLELSINFTDAKVKMNQTSCSKLSIQRSFVRKMFYLRTMRRKKGVIFFFQLFKLFLEKTK